MKYRQQVERTIVRAFIDEALKQGWTLNAVDNGEDQTYFPDADAAMEAAFACDEAHILFKHPEGSRSGWVFIVLGNEGWTVISDYTVNLDAVNEAITPLIDRYEEELS